MRGCERAEHGGLSKLGLSWLSVSEMRVESNVLLCDANVFAKASAAAEAK